MADVNVEMGDTQIQLERVAGFLAGDIPESALDEIGMYATAAILDRTSRGVDAQGRRFKPYSKSYKKFRQESGRAIGRVNLFFTGQMTAALTHKTQPAKSRVILFFSTQDAARKAMWNQMRRDFFNLSTEDREMMENILEEHINGGE